MAHHRIVIETSAHPDGGFRASTVEGPRWARGWHVDSEPDESRETIYAWLCDDLRWTVLRSEPTATFEFIHHEA